MKRKASQKVGIIAMQPHWKEMDNETYIRFPEEIKKQGFESEILFFDKFCITFGKKIKFYYDEKEIDLGAYKLLIPVMAGSKGNHFLVEAIEEMGFKTRNSLKAISICKNKLNTLLVLKKAGLPVVEAAMNFSEYRLDPILNFFKEDEYVCKYTNGSLGKGVAFLKTKLSLISTFELLASVDVQPSKILFEKFIKESAGRDIRVIVVGNKVVASMERTSNGFDFRANLWGGGKGSNFKADKKIKEIAVQAIKTIGLDYGGVDFVMSKDGPIIIEVNANPGMKIEGATGINVAGEIIKYIINKK